VVEDSLDSITDAIAWSMQISKREGAPTIVLSNLRAANSSTSGGGTASGPCSFALVFDAAAAAMLRPGKKNGVLVMFLDADHPDIDEWLQLKPEMVRGYLGVLIRPTTKITPQLLDKLATAYDQREIDFICKTTEALNGETLYPNVCTEIRQSHKGSCTLAAIRVYELANQDYDYWSNTGKEIGKYFQNTVVPKMIKAAKQNPNLYKWDNQIGIGLVGFANLLLHERCTYAGMVEAYRENVQPSIQAGFFDIDLDTEVLDPHTSLWFKLIVMWKSISDQLPKLDRILTQQPTAATALRCKDNGFSVAPELAPPYAVLGSDGLARSVIASALNGSKEVVYPVGIELRDDVPCEVYHEFLEQIQEVWIFLDCAHTISFSSWYDTFTRDHLTRFIVSDLGSLYYRLDPTPASTFSKTETWDSEGDISDLFEPVAEVTSCSDRGFCEVCSM
jgi:hypothetical protein